MPLRCLLFSSNAAAVQPIWQVLTELGIEGEHCQSAVDAVEKVTTQSFQLVITDWDDQPEAGFLLKTARDLKAAQRPLTLAIVSEDARPVALQAGANSVLLKPIRVEQVRDTLSTACELLQSKVQMGAPAHFPAPTASTAAAGAAISPAYVTQAPDKIRAGEFLQPSAPGPGSQFDTDSAAETLREISAAEDEADRKLEPMAAEVDQPPAALPEPKEALTGWAMLQDRLTKSAPKPVAATPAKSELLSYGETPGVQSAVARKEDDFPVPKESRQEASEAVLFDYMSGKSEPAPKPAARTRPELGKYFLIAALVIACAGLAAIPRARQIGQKFYGATVQGASRLLNPPPAPLPQPVALHDSFGQAGDEYKLPVPTTIPDATTDISQIRVLPVVDPTAKPQKAPETNGVQDPGVVENTTPDGQSGTSQSPPVQVVVNEAGGGTPNALPSVPRDPMVPVPSAAQPQIHVNPSASPVTTPGLQLPPPSPAPSQFQHAAPLHTVSANVSPTIPSSLRSQTASSAPEASGNKAIESAMASIEPVSLPELVVRELLIQPVDPQYPAAAKASGQRGSVILQVLIGRDGMVQDAKFQQGSLVFARSAIDAVRQWRFKPYSMNGRAVSVESVITLNFKPSA